MERKALDKIEGIAFGCILSVLCAVALTKCGILPNTAMIYWLIFVVFAGVSVNPALFDSIRGLLLYCLIPAGTLIMALIFRGALDYVNSAVFLSVATLGRVPANADSIIKIGFLYLVIFLLTAPGIAVASLSRTILLSITNSVWSVKTAKVKSLEKNIISCLRIIGLLLGALMAFR